MRVPVAVTALVAVVALAVTTPAGSATRLPGFRSPSGNIGCLVVRGGPTLLCRIARADYAAGLQAHCLGPTGAGVDWHGFELVAARKGAIECSGGILYDPTTERPSDAVLAYGRTWRQKMFSCTSRVAGVTCSNTNGHGFFLSRETWRVW